MWDKNFFKKFAHFGVPSHMINRSQIGFEEYWNSIGDLFNQRTLPEEPWEATKIQQLISILNHLDSDKDPGAIRIGEREGRISSPLLAKLSGNFCHGVGRSGNLTSAQPKAAGASLMQNLTNQLILSLIRSVGIPNIRSALTIPMGTGMSIALALRGCLSHYNVNIHAKPLILMPQLDHNSPRKGIEFIGGEILIVPGRFGENHYSTEGSYVDMTDIEKIYNDNALKISAIVSNSAFFAPRVPDNLKKIAKFAQENNLIHIVNNAYGIQSEKLSKLIRSAIDAGRVDAIVQSTDKCFLTPVGGAVITSPHKEVIETISQVYAGRASASPVLQLLVSLLSIGQNGYREKMQAQITARRLLEEKMSTLADSLQERIIDCNNPVSCAMTLKNLTQNQIANLGGYLYNLRVTGPRVITMEKSSFGSCTSSKDLPFSYVVMNAAIGVNPAHINEAVIRLEKAIKQL